jgi:hypothetical protein
MNQLTFLSEEPLANPSRSPDLEADWTTTAATWPSNFLGWLNAHGPKWLVWENVPGVLSSSGGRDFGAILGGMVELGYGIAYRVLDAQFVRVDGFGEQYPSGGAVSSLSDILETGGVPQRFYLSARACSGILRRAAKRGKSLPTALQRALETVAGQPEATAT